MRIHQSVQSWLCDHNNIEYKFSIILHARDADTTPTSQIIIRDIYRVYAMKTQTKISKCSHTVHQKTADAVI